MDPKSRVSPKWGVPAGYPYLPLSTVGAKYPLLDRGYLAPIPNRGVLGCPILVSHDDVIHDHGDTSHRHVDAPVCPYPK